MGLCVFKTKEVRRCVEHAMAAKAFNMAFSEDTPQPGVLFVHDQGVYLMSNGQPRDLVIAEDGKASSYVAYAQHCHPEHDEDWWENSRELVGGDDFGEVFLVSERWLEDCDKYTELHIEVEPDRMELYFAKPYKTPVKA